MPNDIDTLLAGTTSEGMTTEDFLSYTGDFLVGYVQYGNTSELCNDLVLPLVDSSSEVVFNTLVS